MVMRVGVIQKLRRQEGVGWWSVKCLHYRVRVCGGLCNPSCWNDGIGGYLVDQESSKGLKWHAEGLHYTWGSARGSAHTRVPLGAD